MYCTRSASVSSSRLDIFQQLGWHQPSPSSGVPPRSQARQHSTTSCGIDRSDNGCSLARPRLRDTASYGRRSMAATLAAAEDRQADGADLHPDILEVIYSTDVIAEAVGKLGRCGGKPDGHAPMPPLLPIAADAGAVAESTTSCAFCSQPPSCFSNEHFSYRAQAAGGRVCG